MEASYIIAGILGPMLTIMGLGPAIRPDDFREMADEILRSRALIYLIGFLDLIAGLAIVVTHNVWTLDWRVLITLLGWLAVIAGSIEILMPRRVGRTGARLLAGQGFLRGVGVAVTALGVIVSWFGYFGWPGTP